MVDVLNAHLDDLWALNGHYVTEQAKGRELNVQRGLRRSP
jgi:hypothetical protein